jgi:hypothetical protein
MNHWFARLMLVVVMAFMGCKAKYLEGYNDGQRDGYDQGYDEGYDDGLMMDGMELMMLPMTRPCSTSLRPRI